jgi:hypothetical protein
VRLDPAAGDAASIEIPVTPYLTGSGRHVVDEVPLGAPGLWEISITSSSTDGELPRLTGSFSVPAPDGGGGTDESTTTVGTGLSG